VLALSVSLAAPAGAQTTPERRSSATSTSVTAAAEIVAAMQPVVSSTPDYAGGAIELTKRFFSGVTDGSPVTLMFYDWSGKTLQYTVTRDGTAVTGTIR
jgi:hypothetical protein